MLSLSFLSNRLLPMVIQRECLLEFPINNGVLPDFFLCLMMLCVIFVSMSTILLYSKCDWVSDFWQQLNVIFGTLWIRVGSDLLILIKEKYIFFHVIAERCHWRKTLRYTLEEKLSFKILEFSFFSKLDLSCFVYC